jgi:hypothetical protein
MASTASASEMPRQSVLMRAASHKLSELLTGISSAQT